MCKVMQQTGLLVNILLVAMSNQLWINSVSVTWFRAGLIKIPLSSSIVLTMGAIKHSFIRWGDWLWVSSLNVMVLFKVPSTSPSTIPTQRHPVKVGLSDAYYVDKPTSSGNSGEALQMLFGMLVVMSTDGFRLWSLVSSASSWDIFLNLF